MSTAEEGLTRKGRRARAALVRAARKVFEEKGYFDTRMSDIADEAGVAYGSAYRYFGSKEQLFREVALAVQDDMLHYTVQRRLPAGTTPYQRIEHANRLFLEAYRDNAGIIATIDQVAASNDTLREIRREARAHFVRKAELGIRDLQDEGLAERDVIPHYAANALGSMLDRFAFIWFSLGEEFDFEEAVISLSRLWARSIGLQLPRRPDDGSLPRRNEHRPDDVPQDR